jgi:hypothetical protein
MKIPSAKDILATNKTDRGSVKNTILYQVFAEMFEGQHLKVLDFGAGKKATHTFRLRELGFDVDAYEWGSNYRVGIHSFVLDKTYDVILMSNVLNTQPTKCCLRYTLCRVFESFCNEKTVVLANYPAEPRKLNLSPSVIHREIYTASKRQRVVLRLTTANCEFVGEHVIFSVGEI